ncbi:hypothetical protein K435DRAFT_759363 [Dendrothele bispora CBS 962.96]|uniref:Thioesterase/thiol ester dehydrase-isomerase n=1 Tax=Dendrothele bispora (strain CBS 962.96) TaxID=1314807 RepID=A0A4S8LQR8_DENBC|nr:hypothetical protein K435DRAFT_759363 [Dendrothele bispora CBS 962.96]
MASPSQLVRPSQLPVITALFQLCSYLLSSTVPGRAKGMFEVVKRLMLGENPGWSSVGRVFLWALLVANARALPFVWHVRVFRPLIYVRFEQLSIMAKCMFSSKKTKLRVMEEWIESISPIGQSPLGPVVVYKSFASFDECDYNLHLSNSSYAKALDGARFKLARELFTQFLRVGGHMPLAATHFHFIKEIPVLNPYEVRVSVGSWDEKWVYILCRFVTKKKPGQKKSSPKDKTGVKNGSPSTPSMFDHAPVSDSGTPSLSSTGTPNPTITINTSSPIPSSSQTDPEQTIRTLTSKLALSSQQAEDEEGYTLHTVTVSLMCFKIGRITVPPNLVMAASGLCAPPTLSSTASPEEVVVSSASSLPNPFSPAMLTPDLADGEWSSSPSSNNPSVILTSASPLSPSEPSKGTTTELYPLQLQTTQTSIPVPVNGLPPSSSEKEKEREKWNEIREDSYSYSHENPPPHWKWVLGTISAPHGGSVKKMNRLMKGVWKEIPRDPSPSVQGGDGSGVKAEVGEGLWHGEYQGGRWWERALEGLEEERKERLGILEGLKIAMSGVRGLK